MINLIWKTITVSWVLVLD